MNKIDWTKPLIPGPACVCVEAIRFTGGRTGGGKYIVEQCGVLLCALDEYGRNASDKQIVLNAPEPPQAKPYTFDTWERDTAGKHVRVRGVGETRWVLVLGASASGVCVLGEFPSWHKLLTGWEISINGSPWRPCRDEGTGA